MFALPEMKKYRVICPSTCICTYTSVHVHDNAQIVTDVKAVKAETGATSNTPGPFQSLVKEDRFIYNGHMLVDIKCSRPLTLPLFQPSTGNTPTKMIEQHVSIAVGLADFKRQSQDGSNVKYQCQSAL